MGFIQEWKVMSRGMVRRDYPEFVTGGEVGNELPVFVYHRVRPGLFRNHLEYLHRNGFSTLNTEEVLVRMRSGRPFSGKEVLLTFDDGLSDVATAAGPLLKTYNMQAVSFLAPYWVGREGLITWEQILALHGNGCLDFQSHGLTHKRIPVSPEITGFVHPKLRFSRPWQIPWSEEDDPKCKPAMWGTPLFRSASRFSDQPQYLDPAGVVRLCRNRVKQGGGRHFFRNLFWRRILFKLAHTVHPQTATASIESQDDQNRRIRIELEESRRLIETRLPGKKVIAFSFPFNEHGFTAERILRELNYGLVFGGIGPRRFDDKDGLFHFRRVSGDFVMRLPGRGRKSLLKLFWIKAIQRLLYGHGY